MYYYKVKSELNNYYLRTVSPIRNTKQAVQEVLKQYNVALDYNNIVIYPSAIIPFLLRKER